MATECVQGDKKQHEKKTDKVVQILYLKNIHFNKLLLVTTWKIALYKTS